ncbi:response regulator PleD (plasmid) [Aquisphaera giovannonii]|uniref:diguanylate cyclase n=1 Tax=Aquisphaera giovannonii TaxID=406548 RepID=A0A5B9WFI2_9BACT|nr:response regulator PleD [Aquisphaera giovannonii]
MTASFGVATVRGEGAGGDALLAEADQAMYRAKRGGRNRVVHHDDPHPDESMADVLMPHHPTEEAPAPSPGGIANGLVLLIDDHRGYNAPPARRRSSSWRIPRRRMDCPGPPRAWTSSSSMSTCPTWTAWRSAANSSPTRATAEIPLLCLSSALEDGADRALALTLGADAALPKSVGPEELRAVAVALIRARRRSAAGCPASGTKAATPNAGGGCRPSRPAIPGRRVMPDGSPG